MRYAIRASAGILFAAAAAFLVGCATAREYGSAQPVFNERVKTPPPQISDPDIARAFEARSQMVLPSEVAFFEETYPSWRQRDVAENEMSNLVVELLGSSPEFSKISVISPHFISGPVTPRSVRLAAAYHGAPLTLLCDDDFRVEVNYSPLSILNLTIIGAMIVPSTWVAVETRVGMHLMDTRNGYIYYSGSRTKSGNDFFQAPGAKRPSKTTENSL